MGSEMCIRDRSGLDRVNLDAICARAGVSQTAEAAATVTKHMGRRDSFFIGFVPSLRTANECQLVEQHARPKASLRSEREKETQQIPLGRLPPV